MFNELFKWLALVFKTPKEADQFLVFRFIGNWNCVMLLFFVQFFYLFFIAFELYSMVCLHFLSKVQSVIVTLLCAKKHMLKRVAFSIGNVFIADLKSI